MRLPPVRRLDKAERRELRKAPGGMNAGFKMRLQQNKTKTIKFGSTFMCIF